MPTYDYKCTECSGTMTITAKITDKQPKPKCPCGNPMQRIYNLNAIIFKGNGWANKE